jgi:hypothetical protein
VGPAQLARHLQEGAAQLPDLRLFAEYCKIVDAAPLAPSERSRCRLTSARWWFTKYNLIRASVDVASVAALNLISIAETVIQIEVKPPRQVEPTGRGIWPTHCLDPEPKAI